MFGFQDAPVGVQYSELAEEAVELVSHLRLVSRPETRELLDRHTDDTFRTHQIDASNPRAVVQRLHTSFLIESANVETGNVVDWTSTQRAERLLSEMDEHGVYVTRSESEAVLQVGAKLFQLPEPDVWWTTADVDVELHPRELSTLRDAGLVRREIDMDGYSAVWRTSDRLHSLASLAYEVVTND